MKGLSEKSKITVIWLPYLKYKSKLVRCTTYFPVLKFQVEDVVLPVPLTATTRQ